MKVLAIQGSPRKSGNTATLLDCYVQGVQQNHGPTEIKTVHVGEKNIQPCRGCDECSGSDGKCVIKDDMQDLSQDIFAADVLVLASPVYWWNITAQLKLFVDRFYSLKKERYFKGKKFVLLMTYAGEDPNSGAEIVKNIFHDISDYLEMYFVQAYGVSTGDTSVQDNPEARKQAYDLGKAL